MDTDSTDGSIDRVRNRTRRSSLTPNDRRLAPREDRRGSVNRASTGCQCLHPRADGGVQLLCRSRRRHDAGRRLDVDGVDDPRSEVHRRVALD
jgi:hypothetical protein